ncbi:MAG: DUF4837 family protein [Candidatus Marinimicrobia bacterium]|nr:DUF4837 family protein [Candidatus Neomarinimicrobiota bacterium]
MKKQILLCLLVLFLSISCSDYKSLADGSDIAIMTLVNDDLWDFIEEDISKKVEFEIRTPQIEQLFYFSRIPLEDYKEHRNDKLVLLVATLAGQDEISTFIQKSISESVRNRVASGEKIFFYEYNKYADRQTYMLLLANTKEELLEFIRNEGKTIYQAINNGFLSSQFNQIYHIAEEEELSESIFEQFGFSFRLPHDYEIIYVDSSRHILHLGCPNPQRNIIVYWHDGGFNKVIDQDWALRMKYWLMMNLMDKIYIEKSYARYRTVEWSGVIINNIRGLWGHPTKLMGGPFTMFYFYDGVTNRTYLIDCMMYAPGQSKAVFLRQMEIISSTFYTSR